MAFRFFSYLAGLISWWLDLTWGLYARYKYSTRSVPPVHDALLLRSATDLAKQIRDGEITSSKLVSLYVDRIKVVNKMINALTSEFFASALRQAAEIDHQIAELRKAGKQHELDQLFEKRPFLGVPVSVKHTYAMRGELWTGGLHALRSVRATRECDEVRRFREAGLVVICATNISELGMWMESNNPVFGRTLNPYNLSRCVGGSSGGEGALIGAAGSIFGIGSDIGGSVRIPAAFNGVFGHKPSRNLGYDPDGHCPPALSDRQRRMLVYGPLCRYASDLWPLLVTMLGEEGRAKICSRSPSQVNLKRIKFLYYDSLVPTKRLLLKGPFSEDAYMNRPDEPVNSALNAVLKFVRDDLQADLSELELEQEMRSLRLVRMFDIWGANMMSPDNVEDPPEKWTMRNGKPWELAKTLNALIHEYGTDASDSSAKRPCKLNKSLDTYRRIFCEAAKHFISQPTRSLPVLGLALLEALYSDVGGHRFVGRLLNVTERYEKAFYAMFERLKTQYDGVIILCPVLPHVAPYHQRLVASSPIDACHTAMYNVLGLPSTVAPILKDEKTNIPACVQVVSALHDDAVSIAFAQLLETKFGGWKTPWKTN